MQSRLVTCFILRCCWIQPVEADMIQETTEDHEEDRRLVHRETISQAFSPTSTAWNPVTS